MKFIHTADLHLASPLTSKFSKEQSRTRKRELFETFERLCQVATEQKVTAVLISGDIFDEENCPIEAKKRYIEMIRKYKDVDFLSLAGNHDESLRNEDNLPDNLKTFSSSAWTRLNYDCVDIYGTEGNLNNLYSALTPNPQHINIVMLHGEVDETGTGDPSKIQIKNLKNKNIDYLALGHIHTYKKAEMDFRGVYCYSGCLEGRGYDECGEKGYVQLQVENGHIESTFVPFALRTIEKINVDISDCTSSYDIEHTVKIAAASIQSKDLLRVELTGHVNPSLHIEEKDIEDALSSRCFHCSVKDRTKPILNLDLYKNEPSLLGEFIRKTEKDPLLTDEEKEQILLYGMRALNNEEVDV